MMWHRAGWRGRSSFAEHNDSIVPELVGVIAVFALSLLAGFAALLQII